MIFSKEVMKELNPFINTVLIGIAFAWGSVKDFFARLFQR